MSLSNKALIAQVNKGLYVKDGILYGVRGKPRKLYKKIQADGYITYTFGVGYGGKVLTLNVARVVAYQKYGAALFKEGIVVRHLNGDTSNFSEDNIAIGTMSENMMDVPKEKRQDRSEHAALKHRKCSDYIENEMCYLHKIGWGYGRIGQRFGISKSTVNYILRRKEKA